MSTAVVLMAVLAAAWAWRTGRLKAAWDGLIGNVSLEGS